MPLGKRHTQPAFKAPYKPSQRLQSPSTCCNWRRIRTPLQRHVAVARAQAVALLKFLSIASGNADEQAVRAAAVARIDLFLKEPDKFTPAPAPPVPPGQPIGEDDE